MESFLIGISVGALGGFFSSWFTLKLLFNKTMKIYTDEISKQYNIALEEFKNGSK